MKIYFRYKAFWVLCIGIIFFLGNLAELVCEQECMDGFYLDGYYIADFDKAMIGNSEDNHLYTKIIASSDFFKLARDNYNKYMFTLSSYSTEPKIPKIIHQIWVGGPVPEKYLSFIDSWKQLHPDWIYKLWTDEDIEPLRMINKRYFDEAQQGAEKADILRYELVYRFGGLYVDIDFKCLKKFDVFNHCCDFYSGFHYLRLLQYGRVANGLFAARPGHPILKAAVREIGNNRHHAELMYRTGPDFFTSIVQRVLVGLEGVNIIFPANYFYPYGERNRSSTKKGHDIDHNGNIFTQPETVAVHFFDNNWHRFLRQ